MRTRRALSAGVAVALGIAAAAFAQVAPSGGQVAPSGGQAAPSGGQVAPSGGQTPAPTGSNTLRPLSAFTGIADEGARSVALFEEAGKVMTHARCVNCHPATDRPRQADSRRLHEPLVVRGADGSGATGMKCGACHMSANYDPARVPGDSHWHLAPASMAWEGRSVGQICEQIKDQARNGKRDMAAILHHIVSDPLVLWAWSPGPGREPAPGTNAEFAALMRAWAAAGAHCPAA